MLSPQKFALTRCYYYWLQRIRSYDFRLGSSDISVSNFLKIGQLIQKFEWGAHSQHGYHINLPLIFDEGQGEEYIAMAMSALAVIIKNLVRKVLLLKLST